MADKRMVSKGIVKTDIFKEMSKSAQLLYYDLMLEADDDGFIGNPKGVARFCEASQKELNELLDKRYLLGWDSGVVVIKHWPIHNKIRADRYHPTTYQKELATLGKDEWGAYTENNVGTEVHTTWQPNDNQMEPQVRLGLGKDRLIKENKKEKFSPPSREDLSEYIKTNKYNVDVDNFINYYESNGWKVGKNPMKDWKATVRSWNARERKGDGNLSYDTNKVREKAQEPIIYTPKKFKDMAPSYDSEAYRQKAQEPIVYKKKA